MNIPALPKPPVACRGEGGERWEGEGEGRRGEERWEGGREGRGGRVKGSGDGWGLRVTVQRKRWKCEEMNAGREDVEG